MRKVFNCLVFGLTLLALSQGQTALAQASAHHTQAGKGNSAPAKGPHNIDFSSAYNGYVGRLKNKIYPTWDLNTVTGKNHVVLQATVAADGSVSDITTTSTPSNSAAEEAARSAFTQSEPLEGLPSGSPPARITLTFDSTYDPHGDSNSNMSARMEPMQFTGQGAQSAQSDESK